MTGIEQARANIIQMQANADKLRNDIKFENRKFVVQLLALLVGAFAAGPLGCATTIPKHNKAFRWI